MNIKTRFNQGEDVYIINDSLIKKCHVIGFSINSIDDFIEITYHLKIYILVDEEFCKLGYDKILVNESCCYRDIWEIKDKFEFLEKLECITIEQQKQSEEEKQSEISNNTEETDDLPF